MAREQIILIGGGGHCTACIDVIEATDRFEIAGIVDVKKNVGRKILGYEIKYIDDDLTFLIKRYGNFLVTLGQIKSAERREELFGRMKEMGAMFPVIISPRSTVSRHTLIGEGTLIMHHAVVNAGVAIGSNCIVNTGAIIEHDAAIGDHCHISTGAIINGKTTIKDRCFIGSNSVMREAIDIGENSVIGAGLRVMRSIGPNSVLKGAND